MGLQRRGPRGERGNKRLEYFVVGNPGDADRTPTGSGLALVGGGTDVDAVFTWMGAKANGGDFVVIRADGTDAYNAYIHGLVPELDSVATLVIDKRDEADDPFVYDTISQAEAVFIAGGDQADYINFWTDTGVEQAIYDAPARGAPVGGTSAGPAVLGEFDFAALKGTITSAEALDDPYDKRVTIDSNFLSEHDFQTERDIETGRHIQSPLRHLNGVITDSHFMQRDRMGRLVTFLARLDKDGLVGDAAPRGIGINEQTALLVEADGTARVVGNPFGEEEEQVEGARSVYFLQGTEDPTISAPKQPLTYGGVEVQRATYDPVTGVGDTFNLGTWEGEGVDLYFLSAAAGILSSSQAGGGVY